MLTRLSTAVRATYEQACASAHVSLDLWFPQLQHLHLNSAPVLQDVTYISRLAVRLETYTLHATSWSAAADLGRRYLCIWLMPKWLASHSAQGFVVFTCDGDLFCELLHIDHYERDNFDVVTQHPIDKLLFFQAGWGWDTRSFQVIWVSVQAYTLYPVYNQAIE